MNAPIIIYRDVITHDIDRIELCPDRTDNRPPCWGACEFCYSEDCADSRLIVGNRAYAFPLRKE